MNVDETLFFLQFQGLRVGVVEGIAVEDDLGPVGTGGFYF